MKNPVILNFIVHNLSKTLISLEEIPLMIKKENSLEFMDNEDMQHMETYDFSTLYTTSTSTNY